MAALHDEDEVTLILAQHHIVEARRVLAERLRSRGRDASDVEQTIGLDLAANVAGDAAKSRAQEFDLPPSALELVGMRIAPHHNGRAAALDGKSAIQDEQRTKAILPAKALHGNPYDGHTLGPVITDLEKLTGVAVRQSTATRAIAATTIPTGSGSGLAARSAASQKSFAARCDAEPPSSP